MKTRLAFLLLFLTVCTAQAQGQAPNTGPLKTIASLEVPRYMGTWYEIAKYPNWFQRKCLANTQANYSLQSDGTVRVLNRCLMEGGQANEALGVARQIGGANSPRLQVRFAPQWLSFIPLLWGDYWVIDLDPQYQLVAVSEPRREYLWVLSRTPEIDNQAYDELLLRLVRQGFDVGKLERTPQGRQGAVNN
jgi:apolipoprotein D and lipocalin family protein